MTPEEAYWFAVNNPGCDIGKYQKIVCKNPYLAYLFTRNIPEADISYCQRHCNEDHYCEYFAENIPEADVEYSYRTADSDIKKDIEDFILKHL